MAEFRIDHFRSAHKTLLVSAFPDSLLERYFRKAQMWLFDSYRRSCVDLWGKERGLPRVSIGYPPSFYLHLKAPHAHVDTINILKGRCMAAVGRTGMLG